MFLLVDFSENRKNKEPPAEASRHSRKDYGHGVTRGLSFRVRYIACFGRRERGVDDFMIFFHETAQLL